MAEEPVSLAEFMEKAIHDDGYYRDHLSRFLWILKGQNALAKCMNDIIMLGTTNDLISESVLKANGLVRGNHPQIRPSNKLYADYFKNKL